MKSSIKLNALIIERITKATAFGQGTQPMNQQIDGQTKKAKEQQLQWRAAPPTSPDSSPAAKQQDTIAFQPARQTRYTQPNQRPARRN
jgi:hypothetical protein